VEWVYTFTYLSIVFLTGSHPLHFSLNPHPNPYPKELSSKLITRVLNPSPHPTLSHWLIIITYTLPLADIVMCIGRVSWSVYLKALPQRSVSVRLSCLSCRSMSCRVCLVALSICLWSLISTSSQRCNLTIPLVNNNLHCLSVCLDICLSVCFYQ
jgi:hypothetical protein